MCVSGCFHISKWICLTFEKPKEQQMVGFLSGYLPARKTHPHQLAHETQVLSGLGLTGPRGPRIPAEHVILQTSLSFLGAANKQCTSRRVAMSSPF